MSSEKEYMKEEIRKEFQLERMVLFSDAVFAIAITLMAIEIKVPDVPQDATQALLLQQLDKVMPVIAAYIVSFVFIGMTWYQHLELFSLLKDYNKGVVVRNLIMLFFIGLFPFGASVVSKVHAGTMLPLYIYSGIVFLCKIAQHMLQYYVLIGHPELCIRTDLSGQKAEMVESRRSLIVFGITMVLVIITSVLITNDALKPMSILWLALFPVLEKIFKKKEKRHIHKVNK